MLQRGAPRQALTVECGLAFADQHQSDMGQGRQVTAGAEGAPGRNHRRHPAVEQLHDQLRHHWSHPGVAACLGGSEKQ